MNPKVLLATSSSYYPTARLVMALAGAGCHVEAVCPAAHPLRKTTAVQRTHLYQGLAPLASFARAIELAQPDLIVSGDDLATQHLHSLYAKKKQNGNIGSAVCELIEGSLGNPQSFPIVDARAAFMELARNLGVRVPATQVLENRDDLRSWIGRMGLPAVLKADGSSGGDGVRIVRSQSEAESAFQKLQAPPLLARALKRAVVDHDKTLVWPSIFRHRPIVNAQSFVAGKEATSTVFCWKGAVLAGHHFEVVNKASSAGHATVVRLIENAEMASAVECIVRQLGLSGFCGFDFMLEAETGHAYLIEINPRATQVGHLALGAGRDLPAALYAALTGKDVQPAAKVTEKETIALFPQEWIRDAESAHLHSAHHDVPWEEPELIRDCVNNREKQSAWYRPTRKPVDSTQRSPESAILPVATNPATVAATTNAVGLGTK